MLSKGCVPIPSYVKCVSENQDDTEINEVKFITVALKKTCVWGSYKVWFMAWIFAESKPKYLPYSGYLCDEN